MLPGPLAVESGEGGDGLGEAAQVGDKGGDELGEGAAAGPGFGQQALEGFFGVIVGHAGGAAGIGEQPRGAGTAECGCVPGLGELGQVAAVGGNAGAQEQRGAVALVGGKEEGHGQERDDRAGDGVGGADEGKLPVTGVGEPGENEGGGEEEGESRVTERQDGQREQRQRKEDRGGGELRVERGSEHGGQDSAGDSAADALHAAAHGSGDVGLEDDERGHQQPVAVVDVEGEDEDDIESADQGDAGGVTQGERLGREVGAQVVQDAGWMPSAAQIGEARVDVGEVADGRALRDRL